MRLPLLLQMLTAISVATPIHAFLLLPALQQKNHHVDVDVLLGKTRRQTIQNTGYFRRQCTFIVGPSTSTSRDHKHILLRLRSSKRTGNNNETDQEDEDESNNSNNTQQPEVDTIRVRIWRALAESSKSKEEISITQLSKRLGENKSDVRSHLKHVERQAKTIRNKSDEWRARRGLSPADGSSGGVPKKVQLKKRRGAKNEVFIRLV